MTFMSTPSEPNTSGQGANAVVPDALEGWNTGAAVFTLVWWLANVGTAKPAWAELTTSAYFGHGRTVSMAAFGRLGNRLAWKYKHWPSVDVFLQVQKRWSIGATCLILGLPTALVVAALVGLSQAILARR
jgi:hypothetical protein